MNTDLAIYYKQRAAEYEDIYNKPERQADLVEATKILKNIFSGKHVFEIACGTGYWTQRIAETATSVLATDINQAVIDIALQKHYDRANVSFALADFNHYRSEMKYESLFGGFIWSHIELQKLDQFLDNICSLVATGGTVVFMDNNYVATSSIPVAETDEYRNNYQHRKLADGSAHRVLKNFPTEDFIRSKLLARGIEMRLVNVTYYWVLQFTNNIKL